MHYNWEGDDRNDLSPIRSDGRDNGNGVVPVPKENSDHVTAQKHRDTPPTLNSGSRGHICTQNPALSACLLWEPLSWIQHQISHPSERRVSCSPTSKYFFNHKSCIRIHFIYKTLLKYYASRRNSAIIYSSSLSS